MWESERVKGLTVHETVPSGGGRSAGGFHRSPDNDKFLRGNGRVGVPRSLDGWFRGLTRVSLNGPVARGDNKFLTLFITKG